MTSKPKHTGLGVALGVALGAVAGVMAGHVGLWLGLGVAVGMLLGATFRRKPAECPQCALLHRTHDAVSQARRSA